MRKTIMPIEMKRVETDVMAHTSITGEMLMQRAAGHVADAVQRIRRKGRVICLCATGNNGGDGMAAMRMLAERDRELQGECWILPGKLSQDAQRELDRLAQTHVRIVYLEREIPKVSSIGCIIDALFGTGLCRPLEGLAKACCEWINRQSAPVVAVDIPSGLDGATGRALGEAVLADVTVTFHRPKLGLYLESGPDRAGEIVVGDIGIPEAYDEEEGFWVLEKSDLSRFLPKRLRASHKGSYGRVLLFVGSRGMAGAAALAAKAALRTGAGLVTVACPDRVADIVQTLCPCATCLPLPEDAEEAWEILQPAIERFDAIGAGCGIGQSEWAAKLTQRLAWVRKPVVLDADALNVLAREKQLPPGPFITPHPAEAGRLLGCSLANVLSNMSEAAESLAQDNCVILKSACSILCDGGQFAINPFGTPGMAKGGSGDALTGVLTALLAGREAGAYQMNDLEVMQIACALHGLAGEMAAERFGERGMLADDLCDCLGLVEGEQPNVLDNGSEKYPNEVMVVVEHQMGSRDEENRSLVYPFNMGYVQQVLEAENRWQDACIMDVSEPVEWYDGAVLATVSHAGREIWLVGPAQMRIGETEISRLSAFLEKMEQTRLHR